MYIEKISTNIAHQFMQEYELLGNLGLGVWHWGLFQNNNLVSVVSYGILAFSPNRTFLGKIAAVHNCKIIQLCRGATKPSSTKNAPSKLISSSCKLMQREMGNLLVVAYSNTSLGEIGTIYQACNAIYTGMTDPKGQSNYIICGKKMSGWQVRKKYGTRRMDQLRKIDPEVMKFPLSKKHRYIFVCCPKLRRQRIYKELLPLSQPYPKR